MNRKQLNEDGSSGDEFLINEAFVAMLDFYVATSLSVLASDAEALRPFYDERVVIYQALDGNEGRKCWRKELRDQLAEWLQDFPECASKKKGRLSVGPSENSGSKPKYSIHEDDL